MIPSTSTSRRISLAYIKTRKPVCFLVSALVILELCWYIAIDWSLGTSLLLCCNALILGTTVRELRSETSATGHQRQEREWRGPSWMNRLPFELLSRIAPLALILVAALVAGTTEGHVDPVATWSRWSGLSHLHSAFPLLYAIEVVVTCCFSLQTCFAYRVCPFAITQRGLITLAREGPPVDVDVEREEEEEKREWDVDAKLPKGTVLLTPKDEGRGYEFSRGRAFDCHS